MAAYFRSDEHEKFQEVLRGVRAERKVSQAKVARSMNIAQQTAARFETGQRRMDLVELFDWCRAVGVSVELVVQRYREKVGGEDGGGGAGQGGS